MHRRVFLAAALPAFAQQQPNQPLRLGVLGLVHGHIRGFFNQLQQRQDVELVGVAEANQEVTRRYADQYRLAPGKLFVDAGAMLDQAKPEAVVIQSDTFDHLRLVQECARRRVHAMMEKPLAVSNEHARGIAAAARQGKIHILVNYETTWYRSNLAAYNLARSGLLGGIRKVVVHDGHKGPREIGVPPEFFAWLTDPARGGGGALFDFGCYGANLMTWLMDNQRPTSVVAVTQTLKPQIYGKCDDEATIICTYPQAQAIFQASWNWPHDRKDMEVYGATGQAITVKSTEIRVRPAGAAQEELRAAAPLPELQKDALTHFKAVVGGEIKPNQLSSLENNLIVTEILDAARKSAQTGRAIKL